VTRERFRVRQQTSHCRFGSRAHVAVGTGQDRLRQDVLSSGSGSLAVRAGDLAAPFLVVRPVDGNSPPSLDWVPDEIARTEPDLPTSATKQTDPNVHVTCHPSCDLDERGTFQLLRLHGQQRRARTALESRGIDSRRGSTHAGFDQPQFRQHGRGSYRDTNREFDQYGNLRRQHFQGDDLRGGIHDCGNDTFGFGVSRPE
jgi:hypothetical protein